MNHFLIVAAGGAIGAALRHGVGLISLRHLPSSWPWATFTVNVLGGFAMGLLVGWLALKAEGAGQAARLFLATGLLGGFTTFSAFSLETVNMIRTGETAKALAYIVLSVALSLAALGLGLVLARRAFA
ncbi:MAG: fluoride efflux transporter CrcB [Hyphomonas sp.]|jgi:CrcB protein|uniref:fluoride efflux transporter CrcB n=1 Tax=Hyphomonas sp. TaxID=87 RepID=UPI0017B2AE37|nr:fluoride efflux transporter CrcB [Hyphomonas sp.]MBU3919838.1 fluoride efflux transporter CrcB [Alphaproteobacteria bacterium]MBA3068175.1 fluoride efflux transporter CrcB [Hyphomonas sp.]MBU4062098.1 fluoride efflux transporter CrcB [Alphaproteobacteria bacterium]MBU4165532.1 fluoride efflux transporter CrcB [Alphaproteobacteria bacterium]MBU4569097.1 fluoride efflux transporter CrcB [Alphaproteobacteria bacterium]